MIQPSAKKETPARMAVPQAWEYHLAYSLVANFHCSRSVAGSGFTASGGFRNRTFWPEKLASVLGVLIWVGVFLEEEGSFWLESWWWSVIVSERGRDQTAQTNCKLFPLCVLCWKPKSEIALPINQNLRLYKVGLISVCFYIYHECSSVIHMHISFWRATCSIGDKWLQVSAFLAIFF